MSQEAWLKYEYKGKLMTLSELMPFCAVEKKTLMSRLNAGWEVENALTKPKGEFQGVGTKRSVNKEIKETPVKKPKVDPIPWFYYEVGSKTGSKGKGLQPIEVAKAKRERNIEVSCDSCGGVILRSHEDIRKFGRNATKCYGCRKEEKNEFNQAMINLAKRKGLIK